MRTRIPALLSLLLVTQATVCLSASPDERAGEILSTTGVKGGLIVHLECGDGRLTAALQAGDAYLVHGLDRDAKNVARARKHIRSLGRYGSVSVDQWVGGQLPYTDNLVTLLVAEDLGGLPMAEVMRVLAPLGVAYVKQDISWSKSIKPWPESIDEWTHFLHGPDNNALARDTVIGPPAQVQWTAGPRWSRDHDVTPSVFAPVSARGRLFYLLDEGPVCVIDQRLPEKHSLVARDAFNGMVLWKRPLADWYSSRVIWGHIPIYAQRRLVALKDRVYTTLGLNAPVTALDAATGATIRSYKGTEHTSEIVCNEGVLVLAIRHTEPLAGLLAGRDGRRFRKGYPGPKEGAEAVMAVEADTGTILWRKQIDCLPLTLATSSGCVYLVQDESVVSLDLKTGQLRWRQPSQARTLVVHEDVVLVATGHPKPVRTIELTALAAKDGKTLWTAKGDCLPNFHFFFAPVDLFVGRGLVWALAENLEWNSKPGTGHLLGLDLHTGQVRERLSLAGAFTAGHHVRCYKGKATERYLLFNKRGIEFVDTAAQSSAEQCHWIRGACRYGILPCNGLIYAPPHACACYPGAKLDGFYALAPAVKPHCSASVQSTPKQRPVVETAHPDSSRAMNDASGTGQRAPTAFERQALTEQTSLHDWPTYRHDDQRSGSTSATVPAQLTTAWQVDLGGKLTAPVVAGGRVYLAAADEHTVYCLDAKSGTTQWTFTAGARIDSPPTIHRGRTLFGSRDGCVYCVRSRDGSLIWRFQAAPADRRVGAFGQLESAWPVHGSVLVHKGVAYLAAGRSCFLEGGIHLFGLDVDSGEVRFHRQIDRPAPQTSAASTNAGRTPGVLPDILSSDGEHLYMGHVKLSPDLSNPLDTQALTWGVKGEKHLLPGSGFLDGSLFNRTVWRYGVRVDRSQLLVVDGTQVYGLRVYSGISWNCPVYNLGDGYLLFRQNVGKPVPRPPKQKQPLLNRIPYERYTWHQRVPVRVQAMVLAGASARKSTSGHPAPVAGEATRLFVAGLPEEIVPDDPLAALEGRRDARLCVLAAADGSTLAEYRLDAPPVWDGMAATAGRLYLATSDGKMLCMAGKNALSP